MPITALYAFDRADAELSLLPMAARRALDLAGMHLSLAGWQLAPLALRQIVVELGAREHVPIAEVSEALAELSRSGHARPVPALIEPDPAEPPPNSLLEALGAERPLSHAGWSGARALDRYVLLQLAGRGKRERLIEAYLEIVGR
jgi:Conserved nitrate reductase-associated protein (Nitr_red_assoc)